MSSVAEAAQGSREAARALELDDRTQLVVGGLGWSLRAYPELGEVTGGLVRPRWSEAGWDEACPEYAADLEAAALARAEDNERRSAGRRRRQMVRYAVRNKLRYLWTLTFADGWLPEDRQGALREVERFVRRLRAWLGEPCAYLAVVERGTRGTRRLHVHLLLGVAVPVEAMEELWGRGFVKLRYRKPRAGQSVREACRGNAGYCAKYAGKGADEAEVGHGRQFYRLAEGFRVRVVEVPGLRWEQVREVVALYCGDGAEWWSSEELEDWRGPPSFAAWACRGG